MSAVAPGLAWSLLRDTGSVGGGIVLGPVVAEWIAATTGDGEVAAVHRAVGEDHRALAALDRGAALLRTKAVRLACPSAFRTRDPSMTDHSRAAFEADADAAARPPEPARGAGDKGHAAPQEEGRRHRGYQMAHTLINGDDDHSQETVSWLFTSSLRRCVY